MTKLRIPPHVHTREFDGELILLDLGTGQYFALDAVGGRLWSGVAAGRSVEEVAAELVLEYDVTADVLLNDLRALCNEWVASGLVERET